MGYSKAADMWSVGCIAFLLISGSAAFYPLRQLSESIHNEVVLNLASRCDLSFMDDDPRWKVVSNRPKHFVRSLLQLDETRRLDVKQALSHSWFTNPKCAKDFETVYQYCIRHWKPRQQPSDSLLIQEFDLIGVPNNCSRHFTANGCVQQANDSSENTTQMSKSIIEAPLLISDDKENDPISDTTKPIYTPPPSRQPENPQDDTSQLSIDQMQPQRSDYLSQRASSITFSEHSQQMSGYEYFSYVQHNDSDLGNPDDRNAGQEGGFGDDPRE